MGGSPSTHFELSSDERAVLERLVDELRSGRMPALATSTGERIPLPDDLRGSESFNACRNKSRWEPYGGRRRHLRSVR